VSDKTSPLDHPNARPFMSLGVVIYFGILFVLTFIARIPDAITIGTLLFIVPGQILVAASTLLYYSIAVLPAYFIDRFFRKRLLAAAVATFSLAAAALLPHHINGYLLRNLVASDHSDPPISPQPRSFELPYPEGDNYWMNSRRPESHQITPPPPCADLCQQLLFKGNVDQVVIRDHPDPLADATMNITKTTAFRINRDGSTEIIPQVGTPPNPTEFFKPRVWRFRLQQREACPDTLSRIKGKFVHEVLGGRCLIEDTIGNANADVVLSISEPPDVRGADRDRSQSNSCQKFELRKIETGPITVTIAERGNDRMIPVEVKTTLAAHYATIPFYFNASWHGLSSCLVVATDPFPSRFADPFEMLGRRYQFQIAPTPASDRFPVPVSDEDRTAVNAILKQDYGADEYIPATPSRLVASFVNVRLKSGQLIQDDIELIRLLLKQRAFAASIESDKLPPASYQALRPLLPEMFERIAYRADGQSEIVQSLNVMLDHFSAEDTDPYLPALCRDKHNGDLRVCYKREFRNSRKN